MAVRWVWLTQHKQPINTDHWVLTHQMGSEGRRAAHLSIHSPVILLSNRKPGACQSALFTSRVSGNQVKSPRQRLIDFYKWRKGPTRRSQSKASRCSCCPTECLSAGRAARREQQRVHPSSTASALPPQQPVHANISADGSDTSRFVSVAGGTRELAESKEVQPKWIITLNCCFWYGLGDIDSGQLCVLWHVGIFSFRLSYRYSKSLSFQPYGCFHPQRQTDTTSPSVPV